MISINYRDSRPIYEQIKSEFRRLILTGALSAGSRLPSIRELASELAINPNTIQRAYHELEAEGTILSIAGKGSFVAERQRLSEIPCAAELTRFREAAGALRALGFSSQELSSLLEDYFREEAPHD
jgi:GntR family transcriptional regulator